MSTRKPPVCVIIVAAIYLAVGIIGFVYHFHTLLAWQKDSVWVESTELLAVVAGVFLLRGQNWARWLAVAWMAFHVVLSAFHSYVQMGVHAAFLVVIAWALFRPGSGRYFRRARNEPEQANKG